MLLSLLLYTSPPHSLSTFIDSLQRPFFTHLLTVRYSLITTFISIVLHVIIIKLIKNQVSEGEQLAVLCSSANKFGE